MTFDAGHEAALLAEAERLTQRLAEIVRILNEKREVAGVASAYRSPTAA